MENIAIFSSGEAPASSEITRLFNEGNRFRIVLLVTDNPEAPIISLMQEKGIEIIVANPEELSSPSQTLAEELKKRHIDYAVVENFNSTVDPLVAAAIPNELIYAETVENLPSHFAALYFNRNKANPYQVQENDCEWADAFKMRHPEPPAVNTAAEDQIPPVPLPGAPIPPQHHNVCNVPPVMTPPRPAGMQSAGYNSGNNQEQPPMPSSYFIWSIIALLLCCIPGIIAIIFSSQVTGKYFEGDYEGAKRASDYAQICIIIAIVLGVVSNTIIIPLML